MSSSATPSLEEVPIQTESLGADKGFFHQGFIEPLLEQRIHPHIAVEGRGKTPAHARVRMRQRGKGYQLSQRCRKKFEELFGEAKDWHGLRRFRRRRLYRVREETWLIWMGTEPEATGEADPADAGNRIAWQPWRLRQHSIFSHAQQK